MIKVYGENGITFKIAVKLETQERGKSRFFATMRRRYQNMHGEITRQDYTMHQNDRIFLFPNFGKRGRSGHPGETCFGEPDMIIGTSNANFIFEFETAPFSRLIHLNNNNIIKTTGLPYQLCRFYQLGELLLGLNENTILDPRQRCVDAYYHFIDTSGKIRTQYYFNFTDNGATHSFEEAVLNLLGKNNYYVISVTNDNTYEEARAGLNQMLGIIGNRYDPRRFIVLTYNDLQNRNCFGEGLQLYLQDARQGFQAINFR